MYWSLYGNIAQSDLADEQEALLLERRVGEIIFALWLLVSAVVLLNMLIALIDAAFDRVKTVRNYFLNVIISCNKNLRISRKMETSYGILRLQISLET